MLWEAEAFEIPLIIQHSRILRFKSLCALVVIICRFPSRPNDQSRRTAASGGRSPRNPGCKSRNGCRGEDSRWPSGTSRPPAGSPRGFGGRPPAAQQASARGESNTKLENTAFSAPSQSPSRSRQAARSKQARMLSSSQPPRSSRKRFSHTAASGSRPAPTSSRA